MNKLKRFAGFLSVCIFIILFFSSCEVKSPVTENAAAPELSDVSVPDTLYLASPDRYPVQARVSDPQGIGDVAAAVYTIYNSDKTAVVLSDSLHDDGTSGDVIPFDGVFYDSLSIDFASGIPGDYLIDIQAVDLSGHTSNVFSDTMKAVNAALNHEPVITNPAAPDTLSEDMVSSVFVSIQVDDADGQADIDSVIVWFYPPLSPAPFSSEQLLDDGTGADATAGDGIFSGEMDLSDDAPVLSDLIAPDTISRQESEPVLISVLATDAQGPDDIQHVYFNTTKPDGTPALGNPFYLYDDGDYENHGDETGGDGIYSTFIVIDASNALGQYRFDFIAEDYSNYSWDSQQGFFRFQAMDKNGRKSDALVLDTVSLLEEAVFDTLTHYMTVVE